MTTPSRRYVRPLACVLAVALPFGAQAETAKPKPINYNDPPQGVFEDHWYAVVVNGQHAGFSRIAHRRKGDQVESLNYIELKIQRGPIPIEMTMKSRQRETLKGEPIGFEAEQNMSLMSIKKKGTIRDGRVLIKTTQGGKTTRSQHPWDPKAKMAWAVALELNDAPIEPGKTFELYVYDVMAKASGPVRTVIKVKDKEKVKLLDRTVEAYRCETTSYIGMPITSVSYVDESGTDVKITMDLGIIKAELIACSEAQARRKAAKPPELFIQTFIELTEPFNAASARRIKYKLDIEGEQLDENMFPTTAMQRVISRKKGEIVVEVQRLDWDKLERAEQGPIPDAVKPCLAASTFVNAKDPKIVELARKAVGDETQPAKMADKLRRFATEYIHIKDFSVGLGTASEVAQSKQGDCTEHAVFLAALARAVGIPARCVGGIVHVSELVGRKNLFGYHMWTQVWIGGKWVDIDAALRQTECDPSHIAMTVNAMNEDGATDLALGILPFLGKTNIKVLAREPLASK